MKIAKLRDAAEATACVRCDAEDGTTSLAHYSGPRQHAYGKGRSIKGHDLIGADLCLRCHSFFDSYETGNTIERSEEFLHLCMLTIIRRHEKGLIK